MRCFRHLIVGLVFCVSICPLFVARIPAAEDLEKQIDALASPYVKNEIVVGMSIGVWQDGSPTVLGYGTLSAEDKRKPDADTVYEIGSISKVFTGVLLADAVSGGHVKLDQPAGELLPADVKMPSRGERLITLQDLSTHVSGLPRLPNNLKMIDPNNPYADYSVEDLHAFLNAHKLRREAGAKAEYSNLAQGLLGHLLARNQQTTYEKLLVNRVVTPLKMESTSITLSEDQKSRLAPPHTMGGEPAHNWDIPVLAGAGAIRSSVNDLVRFMRANLEPPKNELGKALDLAWQVHQEPLGDEDFAMGLGWHLAKDGSTRWHNGQTGGYHSMMLVNRELSAGVVVLANNATGEVDVLAQDIIRLIAGQKVEPRSFEETIEVAAEELEKYVGKYQLIPGVVFTVTTKGHKLMVQLSGQPAFRVYPRSKTEWFYKVVKATITFELDDDGKCNALVLFQNGIKQKARRVE